MHDCVGVIIGGGVQHTDGPLQVKYWGGPDPCDPCGVDAYDSGPCRRVSSSTQTSHLHQAYMYRHRKPATGDLVSHVHSIRCRCPAAGNRPDQSTGSRAISPSNIRQTCVGCGTIVQLPHTCHPPPTSNQSFKQSIMQLVTPIQFKETNLAKSHLDLWECSLMISSCQE